MKSANARLLLICQGRSGHKSGFRLLLIPYLELYCKVTSFYVKNKILLSKVSNPLFIS